MGFLSNLFGSGKSGADAPAKTHSLIAIDWDRISKYVEDLSFVGEYPNAVIWVYVNNKTDKGKISRLLNNRPFTAKEQPSYERRMPFYMLFSVAHELYTNPRYKRVIVVAGDDSLSGAVTHWKSNGLEADIKIFEPGGGGRVSGREERGDRRDNDRGERRERRDNDRSPRGDRFERNDRGDRNERTRPERPERTERAERPERPARPERAERVERVERQKPEPEVRQRAEPIAQPPRPPRPDVIPENDFWKDHPEAVADQVANAIRIHFEIGQSYTISRMAQVVKEATGTSITTLFGHRGNRIMLDKLLEANLLATEDQKNFAVMGHPDTALILNLIENRQDERPDRRRFGHKRGGGGRNRNRHENNGDGSDRHNSEAHVIA